MPHPAGPVMTQMCLVCAIDADVGAVAVILFGSEGGVGGRCATASVDIVEREDDR